MRRSRARWNMAWASTSAPDRYLRLVRAAAAPACAEAVAAGRHTREQHQNRGDQTHDCRQAKREADPVGNRSENNRDKDSDHVPSPLLGRLARMFPGPRELEPKPLVAATVTPLSPVQSHRWTM